MKQLQESEILLTIAALIVGIFILDLATPLGVVIPMLYLVPLWLTIWTSPQHTPFLVAATCAVLTILGFFFSPTGQEQLSFVNRSIVLATLALNALLVWREKKARGALMHEVEERVRAEAELITLASTLEQRVAERTTELKASRAAALNIMEDAAEAKRAAEQAAEASARLAAIVESSDDAIIDKTLDGIVVSWNKGAERIFGYTAEEMIGKPVTVLIPPGRADEEPEIIERLKRGERVEHYETVRRRKDGREIHVSLTVSPIKDARGKIIGASRIARDITERKRAEEEVRRANRELAAVNAELESFSYSVSHDLRAPLRAMQGFAQALLEDYADRLDSVAQDYAQRIVGATRRMDTLMQDLLAYSRLSNADLHLRSVCLASIVAEAQAQLKEALQERKARLTVEETLPQVVGHPTTLVQVVANLLANAAKFVAPGVQPQVRVRAEERGMRTRLWVEDNGIGIESEHWDRIFRVFERLHGIETYPGTGIGLAIVRKGVERMGGLVGVESEPGRGSRFWIELPRVEETHEHTGSHHPTGRG